MTTPITAEDEGASLRVRSGPAFIWREGMRLLHSGEVLTAVRADFLNSRRSTFSYPDMRDQDTRRLCALPLSPDPHGSAQQIVAFVNSEIRSGGRCQHNGAACMVAWLIADPSPERQEVDYMFALPAARVIIKRMLEARDRSGFMTATHVADMLVPVLE